MTKDKKPLVSIMCITYNHGQYIEKALKGFVSQITNFKFEAIIAEDCSTDNSREIIKEYEKKYPSIIKPLYRKKNLGMMANYIDTLKHVKGKYLAICDGDDYWIDNHKLQKQVDFLKKNKKYTVCTNLVKQVFVDNSKEPKITSPFDYVSKETKKNKYLTFNDLFPINGISSCSAMYRWKLKKIPNWLYNCSGGDLFLHMFHADCGRIGVINKVMSVYRRHPGGIWWNNDSVEHQLKFCKSYIYLLKKTNILLKKRHNKILEKTINEIKSNNRNIIKSRLKIYKVLRITKRLTKFLLKKPFNPIIKFNQIYKKTKLIIFAFIDNFSKNKDKTVADLLIIDDQFPQEKPFGFRNAEFVYLLKHFSKIKLLTKRINPPDLLGKDFFNYYKNLISFKKIYPKVCNHIYLQDLNKKYKAKLGYTIFESLAFYNLDFFEKNKIPFIFTLYPGGLFAINNKESDDRKRKIFNSKYFKKVIVPQITIKKYLLDKKMCPKNKIIYIPIGISQITKNQVKEKIYYKFDKDTLDICFVAFNYCFNGYYKGYDIFLEITKKIVSNSKYKNINFHIIGNWDENDSSIKKYVGKNIFFYGVQKPDFLSTFYSKMDILISLSRKQKDGSFDGFPLGTEAGYCGVVVIASDELKQNNLFNNGKDIIIVKLNANEIFKKIIYFYENPKKLRIMSQNGKKTFQKYVDLNYQCEKRIKLFKKELKINQK